MGGERLDFLEFFAGGGMARIGLGPEWRCIMANDICPKKASSYRINFPPADELILTDIAQLTINDLPGKPALAWASFPCQDLSLAGNRNGLDGERSGTFWPFWRLMEAMAGDTRAIPLIVLENVVGAITSNKGQDFQAILDAVSGAGYLVGPLVIDAVHFLPQSRPRLFIVAVKADWSLPPEMAQEGPVDIWHPKALRAAYASLPDRVRSAWIWWRLPKPEARRTMLFDLIEENPAGVKWHTQAETERFLGMMSKTNIEKVKQAQALGVVAVGTLYKRTRLDESGRKAQRAEVRFDQVSGCLRTPAGGSSRQTILIVEGDRVRSRLLSPRELARLMGVPDNYKLPDNYNATYHLMGDGLAVPAVTWLKRNLLFPLALRNRFLEAA